MQISLSCVAAVVSAILSTTHAHMIMKTPVPYGRSTLNNSPLNADGSDFPCKQRPGVYSADGASNTMAIGVPQTLSFTGTAVHGGGSCQISLTTDKAPTKDTQWQVIHSIEGGCPARNVDGNLQAGSNDPDTYQFSIPAGIAPGEYTLAWTWFNRIGNREMYMNCAPVTVTGGKTKRGIERRKEATLGFTKRSTFPAMFLANIGNGCTTVDSKDVIFPDPGSSLEKDGVASNLAAPSGSCGASSAAPAAATSPAAAPSGATTPAAAPSGSSSAAVAPVAAPSGSSSAAAAAPAAPSAASGASSGADSASGSGSGSGSVPASGAGSGSSSAVPPSQPSSSAAAAVPSVAVSPAAAPSAASSPITGGTAAGSLSGACSNEGAWNCLGGTSFQRCASGQWSASQAMPAGTQCTPGQSQNLAMNAIST